MTYSEAANIGKQKKHMVVSEWSHDMYLSSLVICVACQNVFPEYLVSGVVPIQDGSQWNMVTYSQLATTVVV